MTLSTYCSNMDLQGNALADLVNAPWVDEKQVELEQAAMMEAWLDRLLLKILTTASAQSVAHNESGYHGGLRRTGLDRKKLIEGGMEPREVDSLYRALYLHSIGMFRTLKSIRLGQEVEQKVMAAFKLLTTYLPKLGIEPSMSVGSDPPRTKLEVSYLQLVKKSEMENLAWNGEKEALKAQINEHKVNAMKKHEEFVASELSIAQLQQELENCKKDLQDSRARSEALKAVMIRHEDELTRLHEECPDDIKELVRLREENQKAAKRLADTERQLRITMEELEDAAFNTAELQKVKEINETIAGKLCSTEKQLESAATELASLKEMMEKLDRENYALNELYHEEATKCAALRLKLQELLDEKEKMTNSSLNARLTSEVEALRAKVQELLMEKENTSQERHSEEKVNPVFKAEIEGLYLEREAMKETEKLLNERICELESQTHTFKLSLVVLDESMRNIVGGVCLEKQGLRELVESIRENGMKLIAMANGSRKQEFFNIAPMVEDKATMCKDHQDEKSVQVESDNLEEKFQLPDKLDFVEETSLIKMEKACQFIEEELGIHDFISLTDIDNLESNENMQQKSELELEGLEQKLKTSEMALEFEINARRNLEEQVSKTTHLIRSMDLAYQEIVLSNQTLRSEIETLKLNLLSATSDVNLSESKLQQEKRAHADTMSSLSALRAERINDMENHNKKIDDLTKDFMLALEEEKAAHSKTQIYVLQILEAKEQQMVIFKNQEEAMKNESALQMQNHRNQISVIIKEFQDTVGIFLTGIESVHKLLAFEVEEAVQKLVVQGEKTAKPFPKQLQKESGAFWRALEVLLEALHSIIREGNGTLVEPIKDIKLIAEEKTSELVSEASRIVPDLRQKVQESTREMKVMKASIARLEKQIAVCGPNLKSLTKQLWISWYSSAHSSKALHEIVAEIAKSTLDLWKSFGADVKHNDECSVKFSKIIRALEETRFRLELQMDGSLGLEQSLCELYRKITGKQKLPQMCQGELNIKESAGDADKTSMDHDTTCFPDAQNPFSMLDDCSFIDDIAESLQADEIAVKEKSNLELEVQRLKAKLKSEQVARIWRDKYIRDLVNKYNAQFDNSLTVSKAVQAELLFSGQQLESQDGTAPNWLDLIEQAKKVPPLQEKTVRQKIADIYASKIKYDVGRAKATPGMPEYLDIYFHQQYGLQVVKMEHMLQFISSILKYKDIHEVQKFGRMAGIITLQEVSCLGGKGRASFGQAVTRQHIRRSKEPATCSESSGKCAIVKDASSLGLTNQELMHPLAENLVEWRECSFDRPVNLEDLTHTLMDEATKALLRVPGLPAFLDVLSSPEFLSTANNFDMGVPLSKTELPQLYSLLDQACRILEMDLPNIYVRDSPFCRAYSWCIPGRTSVIIFNSRLFDTLSPLELQAVMAQQLFLIRSPNVQQLAMAWTVLSLAPELVADIQLTSKYVVSSKQQDCKKKAWFSFATNRARQSHPVSSVIVNSLERWIKFSALSSDRAALIVTQSLHVTVETNLKMAAGSSRLSSQISYEGFLELDETESKGDACFREPIDHDIPMEAARNSLESQQACFWDSVSLDSTSSNRFQSNTELQAMELGRSMQSISVLRAREISSWARSLGIN